MGSCVRRTAAMARQQRTEAYPDRVGRCRASNLLSPSYGSVAQSARQLRCASSSRRPIPSEHVCLVVRDLGATTPSCPGGIVGIRSSRQPDPSHDYIARDLSGHCSTLLRRARDAHASRDWSQFYRYGKRRLIDLLQITPAEERHMRALISDGEKHRRHLASDHARRRAAGMVERTAYLAEAAQRQTRAAMLRQGACRGPKSHTASACRLPKQPGNLPGALAACAHPRNRTGLRSSISWLLASFPA